MSTCDHCQAPIPPERRKPVRFCSVPCSRRAWAKANAEKVREIGRASQARYKARNPGVSHAYYEANKVHCLGKSRAWEAANPERARELRRARNEASREHRREYARQWSLANPERVRHNRAASASKRRARLRGVLVEDVDRAAIIARDKSRCHICGLLVPARDIELDHIVPLAAGGEHTARNLAVAHSRCNRSKGARPANDQLRLVG